jgi:Fe-S-cluster-containing hydrogenase component 2
MTKRVVIDPDKCIGCRTCETVCALSHEGRINPAEARISVAKYEQIGRSFPMLCQKCEDPLCMAACPMSAIGFDPSLGAQIDYLKCIGCKMCIMACPIGGASLNPTSKRVIMCDLCQGDPQCVRLCPEQALEFVDVSTLSYKKRRVGVQRLAKFLTEAIP